VATSDKAVHACQGFAVHADRLETVVVTDKLNALGGVEIDTTPPSSNSVAELTESLDELATALARQQNTMSEWRTGRVVLRCLWASNEVGLVLADERGRAEPSKVSSWRCRFHGAPLVWASEPNVDTTFTLAGPRRTH
jgi:hypothetical protein